MEIAFQTKALRDLCGNKAALEHKLGIAAARALMHRLADVRAANSIQDVVVGNIRPATRERDDEVRVDLAEGWTATFRANHTRMPRSDGEADWSRVTRLKLIDVIVLK